MFCTAHRSIINHNMSHLREDNFIKEMAWRCIVFRSTQRFPSTASNKVLSFLIHAYFEISRLGAFRGCQEWSEEKMIKTGQKSEISICKSLCLFCLFCIYWSILVDLGLHANVSHKCDSNVNWVIFSIHELTVNSNGKENSKALLTF